MTETAFVNKNAQRWSRFEDIIKAGNSPEPDALAEVFLQLTDDLAFARTHYPRTDTEVYLNGLASKFHSRIYQNKKVKTNRFARFWLEEAPLLYYKNRRFVLYSALIFLLGAVIGIVSAANDATYLRLIMGDSYVNMTLDNIERGDPMGVYKKMDSAEMFFFITQNNIQVSFSAFLAGLVFSFGTGYIMVTNAIMLGAFQFFFYQKGLLLTSFLTIWIHGTLEISAIILAGAAGFTMGHGLLFPKTYSRMQALLKGAREGIKMVVALIPIFIVAGFLESYVTRLTEMPAWIKVAIISVSAFFVLFYFVYYPKLISKQHALPKD
jgi:uncharacterized membrane protein SpoIIM required for sporulation